MKSELLRMAARRGMDAGLMIFKEVNVLDVLNDNETEHLFSSKIDDHIYRRSWTAHLTFFERHGRTGFCITLVNPKGDAAAYHTVEFDTKGPSKTPMSEDSIYNDARRTTQRIVGWLISGGAKMNSHSGAPPSAHQAANGNR